MNALTAKQQAAVLRVIERARRDGGRHTEALADGGEAYAYTQPPRGIAWGVKNGRTGRCIAREIAG
jgi:hypothetical protein